MQEIIISVPDEFTKEQIDFIKFSAISQIEAEIKATLKFPQADIDTANAKIEAVKVAMGIVAEKEI